MSELAPWQVVTQWVSQAGRESVRMAGFATFEEARQEAKRLALLLGEASGDLILRSVELSGNFKSLWQQPTKR